MKVCELCGKPWNRCKGHGRGTLEGTMAKPKKVYYEVQNGDTASFTRCANATTIGMRDGWLFYELKDGTTGLKRPGTWRKVDPSKQETK